jgi:hypothetical protein
MKASPPRILGLMIRRGYFRQGSSREIEAVMKRKSLLILLVSLIGVVGAIDCFLYLELRRNRRLSQSSGLLENEIGAEHAAESDGQEGMGPLQERGQSETETGVPLSAKQRESVLENERTGEDQPEFPSILSSSETVKGPEGERADEPLQATESQLGEIQEPEPSQASETPTEALPPSPDEEGPILATSESEPARTKRPVIERSAIALAVENREPKRISKKVSVREERVYCWLHIMNGQGETITVRWRLKGRQPAEAELHVRSDFWRTWSYITPEPNMIGPAQVEILQNGKLLEVLLFEITE